MMQRHIQTVTLFMLLVWLAAAPRSEAQRALPTRPESQRTREIIRHPFDSTDLVEGYIPPGSMKSQYFVGEPIVLPLVLANHTRFPITILTNFNPRSHLKIMIRPEGQPQFQYNGPFFPALYGQEPIKLLPLEEYHSNVIIWADIEATEGLAISKPGVYTIDVTLQVGLEEGVGERDLKPHGGTFNITVNPTPKELAPLIEMFKQRAPVNPPLPNIIYLHLHKNPPAWREKTEEIVNQFPNTVFTPYLWYSLASYYAAEYMHKPAKGLYQNAMICYQYATLPDSPFKEEIFIDLLTFLDTREESVIATDIAKRLLAWSPDYRLGKIGNNSLLQKYLVDTKELDPVRHWVYLP